MQGLTEAEHLLISDAVAHAEADTSGEIVPVLTRRSDGYTDVALAWAAALAFLALAACALVPGWLLDPLDRVAGDWNSAWAPGHAIAAAATLAMVLFAAVLLAQVWAPLKYAMIPGRVKTARVRDRAVALFRVGADRRTQGRTGVLIYLSLAEHRAEIVADAAIAAQVPPEVWGDAMADMLDHIREGRIADGLAAGISDVGRILAGPFPRADDDVNELPDRLVEL